MKLLLQATTNFQLVSLLSGRKTKAQSIFGNMLRREIIVISQVRTY